MYLYRFSFVVLFCVILIICVTGSKPQPNFPQRPRYTVGVGKYCATITEACANASRGSLIEVYPLPNNEPYRNEHVNINSPYITIVAMVKKPNEFVRVSGEGFEYSGVGATPRAIFQFNKGADNCSLKGFELYNAHNQSHNGAGVRINQANNVTVRDCKIHDCDMGVMSNGALGEGKGQLFKDCEIYSNGNLDEPGMNHNLYLGGDSAKLVRCKIHHSLTGHNVKSRTHFIEIRECEIYDSANREIDLVDANNITTVANSDALIINNTIRKAHKMKGNRQVIHFGQDGGSDHKGVIKLMENTIETDYLSPVLWLSAPSARAELWDNIVKSDNHAARELFVATPVSNTGSITGKNNRFIPDSILIKSSPYRRLR